MITASQRKPSVCRAVKACITTQQPYPALSFPRCLCTQQNPAYGHPPKGFFPTSRFPLTLERFRLLGLYQRKCRCRPLGERTSCIPPCPDLLFVAHCPAYYFGANLSAHGLMVSTWNEMQSNLHFFCQNSSNEQ